MDAPGSKVEGVFRAHLRKRSGVCGGAPCKKPARNETADGAGGNGGFAPYGATFIGNLITKCTAVLMKPWFLWSSLNVMIEPDVREYFPDSETVNRALRCLIQLLPKNRQQ